MQAPSQPDLFELVTLWLEEHFPAQVGTEHETTIDGSRYGRIDMQLGSPQLWDLIGFIDKDGVGLWHYDKVEFVHYKHTDPEFFDNINRHILNKRLILGPSFMKKLELK